ncbi:MAG: tetratricopeptide repeat protein [Actinomycetota bacterium]|nr:tetratricopeptide repeat protein [Actinomycetota bacterium]
MDAPAKELFDRGLALLKRGEMLMALPFFEKSFTLDPSNSMCLSYVALLTGLERGLVLEAIELAKKAIAQSPEMPVLYINLGKLYAKAGKYQDAMDAIRQSLTYGVIPEAKLMLDEISPRMRPFFPFLQRSNFLNRWAGKLMKKTGLRRLRMPAQKKKSSKIQLVAKKGW